MARPKVDSRLQNIEKNIAEVKEMLKNGNGKPIEEPIDCLCNDTKKVLEETEEKENEE